MIFSETHLRAKIVARSVVVTSGLKIVYLLQGIKHSPLELQTEGACSTSYVTLETVTSEEKHKDI